MEACDCHRSSQEGCSWRIRANKLPPRSQLAFSIQGAGANCSSSAHRPSRQERASTRFSICIPQGPLNWDGCAQGIFRCRRRHRERAIRTSVTVGSYSSIWHRRPWDSPPTYVLNIRNNRNFVAVVWGVSAWPHSIGAIERRFDSPSPYVLLCPTRIGSGTDSVHALHARFGGK